MTDEKVQAPVDRLASAMRKLGESAAAACAAMERLRATFPEGDPADEAAYAMGYRSVLTGEGKQRLVRDRGRVIRVPVPRG